MKGVQDVADLVPVRQGEWTSDKDGRITIVRSKGGKARRAVLRILGAADVLEMRLDVLGSAAWALMDGRTTREVKAGLTKRFPDEGRIDERFAAFLQQLVRLRMVRFEHRINR